MSKKIIQLNEGIMKEELGEMVRQSVEDTLNALLDEEADRLTNARRYERTEKRTDTRAGHYKRKLLTKAGEVELKVPKLRTLTFETAIIQRYQKREISVEEALVEMYLAGVSVRRVEDITEALWGAKVSAGTVSKLNQKVYLKIEEWRNRPLLMNYPYVYLDGIYLKRNWGGSYENVAILVAMAVNEDGQREVIGAAEGMKEDRESWLNFLRGLKERGLRGTRLFIGDRNVGLYEAIQTVYPTAKYQRCTVHFYRNVFSVVPRRKTKLVAAMLKAIHAQEDKAAAMEKAASVVAKLKEMKLREAAKKIEDSVAETLTHMEFPREHWKKIRSNNVIERLNREIRRRTRVVGTFPDGQSALMLVCARLRYIEDTQWGTKVYLNTKHLETLEDEAGLTTAG
jgi:putative transposase